MICFVGTWCFCCYVPIISAKLCSTLSQEGTYLDAKYYSSTIHQEKKIYLKNGIPEERRARELK
jgi:hypothetical protein